MAVPVSCIEPAELIQAIAGNRANDYALVDVRDQDYYGGRISGSLHVPFDRFEERLDDLISQTERNRIVVFYCRYSRQRGPAAAQLYQDRIQQIAATNSTPLTKQVYVLRGGWSGWKYGEYVESN